MKSRSRRWFIMSFAVLLILLVGGGVAFVWLRSHTTSAAPQTTIVWKASTTNFTQQDQQNIQTALKTALSATDGASISGHEFTITDAERQGDWADFSANERISSDTQPIATEPVFFLAHVQGTTWSVWLLASPGFCDELKQVPDTLLDPIDKHYFLGCYQ